MYTTIPGCVIKCLYTWEVTEAVILEHGHPSIYGHDMLIFVSACDYNSNIMGYSVMSNIMR